MQRIYLDYASTTPLDPRVEAAMRPYLQGKFGNPSSLHSFGQEAMAALDKSRETLANLIGAKFNEVVFTSSATEANNLALRGAISNFEFLISNKFKPRIIVSSIEHESILETAKDLERTGVEVIYLPVDKKGFVDLRKLEESLNENTVLVSIMHANNETGVIQNISEISKIVRNSKFEIPNSKLGAVWPLLHTDASQAFQYLDCNVENLGVDLMTLSSHKIYGPKGAGCLYVRGLDSAGKRSSIAEITTGGGQEFEMRSGTENIPAIVGFTKAAELVTNLRELESRRVGKLCDYLWVRLKKSVKGAKLNGDDKKRLPSNLNVYFPGISAEDMLIKLDLNGVAVSAGSACAARSLEPSRVLLAMGFNEKRAKGSIRFTLGRMTTKKDIDNFLAITKIISKKT